MNRSMKLFLLIFTAVMILVGGYVFFNMSLGLNLSTFHFSIPEALSICNKSLNGISSKSNPLTQHGKKHTGMWTIYTNGRLGNQMGAFSTLLGLANINGHQPYIGQEMFEFLAPYFQITVPLIHEDVSKQIHWESYWIHDWISPEHKAIKGKFVKLLGYPNSWTFYDHIRDKIRKQFTFHDFIRKKVNRYLHKIKGNRKNVTFVGVHVRRGDYVHTMPNTWKGVVADQGYLEKAMTYFREKYQDPIFVTTSDGIEWCKKNMNNSKGDIYFPSDGRPDDTGVDLAMLIHCNHTIMTIGTFGFWAGYLAGGEVMYLDKFVLPDSPFLEVFKYEAFYLPEWIGIAANLSSLQNSEWK